MSNGLISHKLKASLYKHNVVQRNKLDIRSTILSHRITVVSAAAGYGKSTLLSQWQRALSDRGYKNIIVNLDMDDNDPILFMRYVLAGFNKTLPDIGDSALKQIHDGGKISVKTVLRSLIDDIDSINVPIVIFFDDYHFINSQSIHDLLEWMLKYFPTYVTIVIASRTRLPLSTEKLKLNNDLCEINLLDLKFNYEETKLFFNAYKNTNLNEIEIQAIHNRTEGWVTGIQLAHLAIQDIDNHEIFIKEFSGCDRDITDYLQNTVFSKQSDTIKDFMLRTSILDRMNVDICQIITERNDCQKLLEQIEQANLFLISLDRNNESFRYHQLFQKFLQKKLKKDYPHLVKSLHMKASHFFLDFGLETEAVNHGFLSEDLKYTADLITNYTIKYLEKLGQVETVIDWIQRLPDELIDTRPALRMAYIRCLTMTCQYDMALVELNKLQVFCKKIEYFTLISLEQQSKIEFSVAALQARLFSFMDKTQGLRTYCEKGLETWPDGNQNDIATLYSSLAYSCLISFEFDDGLKIAHKGRTVSQNCNAFLSLSWQHLISGAILFYQGILNEAEYHFRQALDISSSYLGHQSEMHCTASTCLAALLYEQNRLEESEAVLNVDFIDNDFVNVESMLLGYRTLAKLKNHKKEHDDALELLRQGESVGYKFNLPRLALYMAAEQVFYYLRLQETEKAIRIANQKGFFEPLSELCGTDNREIMIEIPMLVQIKIAIAKTDTKEAKPILDEAIGRAKIYGRTYNLIQLFILKAEIEWIENNKDEAVLQLDNAIELAVPSNFYRIFFDNCPIIKVILEQKIKSSRELIEESSNSEIVKFLIILAKHFNLLNELTENIHTLTSREKQIITYLESGGSNNEISKNLYISEGTLKWHLHNIYKKLGTKNRSSTISRARKLKLI